MTIDQEWSGEDAPGAMIEPTYVGGDGVTTLDANLELLVDWIAAGNIPNLSALSLSFGGGESTDFETAFTELAAQGVTVLASSGDGNGAAGFEGAQAVCDTGAPGEYSWNTEGATSIDYPGSSPNVLSVGGTANMAYATPGDPGAVLAGQTVWNWCPSTDSGESAGSTGGVSSTFTEPAYQAADPIVNKAMEWAMNVTNTGNFTDGLPPTGCGTGSPGSGCDDVVAASPTARAIPDLAGPAANNTGYFGQSWVSGLWRDQLLLAVRGRRDRVHHRVRRAQGRFLQHGPLQPGAAVPRDPLRGPSVPRSSDVLRGQLQQRVLQRRDLQHLGRLGSTQAYNIALLLGKPFISTNPQGPATVGASYPVSAAVKDDRQLTNVNVSYLEPGASSWANVSLTLKSGTLNVGTWSGAIPAPAGTGVLKYLRVRRRLRDGELLVALQPIRVGGDGRQERELRLHDPVQGERARAHHLHADLLREGARLRHELGCHGELDPDDVDRRDDQVPPDQWGLLLLGRGRVGLHGEPDHGERHPERNLGDRADQVHGDHRGNVPPLVRGDRITERPRLERDGHQVRGEDDHDEHDRLPDHAERDLHVPDRRGVSAGQLQDRLQREGDRERSPGHRERQVHAGPVQGDVRRDRALPGTKWTVDVGTGPKTVSGTGTSLSMTLANGTFSWTASANTGSYNTPSGSFTVNGPPIVVPVTFHSVTGGPAEIMGHPSVTTVRPVGDSPSVAVGTPKGDG